MDAGIRSWTPLRIPEGVGPPAPLIVRAQTMPARSYFPAHEHGWGQLVYAIRGVLNVAVDGRCFVIPPEQAVWLPGATLHSVGSLHGAEFRSLYVHDDPKAGLARRATVLGVSPLLRELVIDSAALTERDELASAYGVRVVALIIESLGRLEPLPFSLPWPQDGALATLCEALYENPADGRGQEAWARSLGMSGRTLARRCERELGMNLRAWRRAVRLFRAVELLGSGASVTEAALALGYASTSSFIYMFRSGTGQSPRRYAGPAGRI